jgi:hypothetical protein
MDLAQPYGYLSNLVGAWRFVPSHSATVAQPPPSSPP